MTRPRLLARFISSNDPDVENKYSKNIPARKTITTLLFVCLFADMIPKQVRRVFDLVEAFVPRATPLARGRLFLLSGEPGRELYCLESNPSVRGRRTLRLFGLAIFLSGGRDAWENSPFVFCVVFSLLTTK